MAEYDNAVNEGDVRIVSFTETSDYRYTAPVSFSFRGESAPVRKWGDVYVRVVNILFREYPDRMASLVGVVPQGKNRIDIAADTGTMIGPQKLENGLYLETNWSASCIVRKIRGFLDLCGVNLDDVRIGYVRRGQNMDVAQGKPGKEQVAKTQPAAQKRVANEGDPISCFARLDTDEDFRFTRPLAVTYFDEEYPVASWVDAFAQVANCLARDCPDKFRQIVGKPIGRGKLVNICATSSELTEGPQMTYRRLENGLWLQSSMSTNAISAKIKALLTFCGVGREHVRIEYIRRSGTRDTAPDAEIQEETFEVADFAPYRKLLAERFPKGFRLDSAIDMERFRECWREMYGSEPGADEQTVREVIAGNTVRSGKFSYLPEMMLPEPAARRLLGYIYECFREGKKFIYFDALYKKFQPEFEGTRIHNSQMLRSYLEYVSGGDFYIRKNYLSADASARANPADEIRSCMAALGVPVKIEDLESALPHIDSKIILRTICGQNSGEFVHNRKHEYFHESIIHFTERETDAITQIIQQGIGEKGYMAGGEVTARLEEQLPAVLERYPFLSRTGLRGVIAYQFRDRFSFQGKIISPLGEDLSIAEVFARFVRSRDSFTLGDLQALARELDAQVPYDAVYENSLRVRKDLFVSRNQAAFDTAATDAAIARFVGSEDYIPLREISFFGSFPEAGFPWNEFLLEHYAADFSEEFCLMHTWYHKEGTTGAIVRKSARFRDYNALLAQELAGAQIPLEIDTALAYLVERGLLFRDQYKYIDAVTAEARAIRAGRG